MKRCKKTVIVTALMAALFLVCAIRGSAAALPAWMPAGNQLAGYSLVWDDSTSVQWFVDKDTNGNVTCSSQVWLKNGTAGLVDANVIGASMIDKGGNVFAKGVDLSKDDSGTTIAKGLLSSAGLNESQINGITNVWDIVVEILRANQGSKYTLTEPVVPSVDNAVMLEFSAAEDYQSVLFCTREDHCMVVYSLNASQDWITWLNSTGNSGLILARMQRITWTFWLVFAIHVNMIVQLANFLGVSSAPAEATGSVSASTSAPAAPSPLAVASTNVIHASAYTPLNDLTAFASAWGSLFPDFPWLLVIVVVVGAVIAVVVIVALVRRRRNK